MGVFEDAGRHYSGMSYAELMMLHHNGTGVGRGKIPARPVNTILMFRLENTNLVSKGLRGIFNKPYSPNVILRNIEALGKTLEKEGKSIFGSKQLQGNAKKTIFLKGRDEPLVDQASLVSKYTYKVVKNA